MDIIDDSLLLEMVRTSPVGICILNASTLVVEAANEPYLTVASRTLEQTIDRHFWDIFPELKEGFEHELLKAVNGESIRFEEIEIPLMRFGKMESIVITFDYRPVKDQTGLVKKVVVWVLDLTQEVHQRHEIQTLNEELQASNEELTSINEVLNTANENLVIAQRFAELERERLYQFFMQAPAGICVLSGPELVFELVNPGYQKLLPGRALLGRPFFNALPELEGTPMQQELLEVYRTGENHHVSEMLIPVAIYENGPMIDRYFTFNYLPQFNNAGEVTSIQNFAYEVTEQVVARKKLEESESRLQSILDTMAEGVGITDANGKLVYANPMAQRLLGLTEDAIKERTYDDPRWQNLRLDGSLLPDGEHPMSIMMQTKAPVYDHEIGVQPPDGERFYISINAAPLLNSQNEFTGGIGTFMDVTERRKAMIKKDDFISVASHELKTPITSLTASLQLLNRMKNDPKPEMMARFIEQSNKSLSKLNNLIKELLNTNRISQGQWQLHKSEFNVWDMISGSSTHISSLDTHDLILTGDKHLKIYADEQQIDQVVVNLVNNAVKYAPDSKEILINFERLDQFVRVSVTDKGPGIPENKLAHLFDRYYRADHSSQQFSGLGLGLYICAEIIKKHDGEIGVDSELGSGSTFWFTLPIN